MTLTFKSLGAALITAGLMSTAQAAAVSLSAVIDFDEPASSPSPSQAIALGDVITNQYAGFGLQFTGNNVVDCSMTGPQPVPPQACSAPRLIGPPPHASSPNFLMNSAAGAGFSIRVLTGFSLSSLVLDLAANAEPFFVSFFDANDGLLSSPLSWASGSNSIWRTEALGGVGSAVRRIEFSGNAASAFAIDNLRFDYVVDRANVPEPAVLSLVALALAGVGLSRRRQA